MAIFKRRYFLLSIAALLTFSCKNDDKVDFPDRIGIKGRVLTQNEFGQPLYEERNGIRVLMETGFREFLVDADNTGNYILGGAPVGRYTFTITKNGYGTVIVRDITISTVNPDYPLDNGAQKLPTYTITKLPNTEFDNLELTLDLQISGNDTTYTLTLNAIMLPAPPPTGQDKGYRVFIGNSGTTSKSNYVYQEHFTTGSANINITFDNDVFNEFDTENGDVLYVVLYGDSQDDVTQLDEADNPTFPNLSLEPSEVVSVILP